MRLISIFIFLFFCYGFFGSFAQQNAELKLRIVPKYNKYLYNVGEYASLEVNLTSQSIKEDLEVIYKITRNGVVIISEGIVRLKDGEAIIQGALSQPGFLRCDISCIVDKDTLEAVCGVGFGVIDIKPKGKLPANFKRFWDEAKVELTRYPIDTQLEEVEVIHAGDAKRYKVSLANVKGTRVYGWLHLPEGDGPFPAVLSIPGSGVGRTGRFAGFTEAGFAVLAIEVHGLKPGKYEMVGGAQFMSPRDEAIENFTKLQNGILSDYHSIGKEDSYRYFHRRSLQGAFRAIDYLYTRADVDTSKIFVFGGSQGGGLSLLAAAIDKRIKAVVASVPGFCDNTDRLPGSNKRKETFTKEEQQQFINTMLYYDAALAAELINVPTMISVGFIDDICRPVNVYSAYNKLNGKKHIENLYHIGHGSPDYWRQQTIDWFRNVD